MEALYWADKMIIESKGIQLFAVLIKSITIAARKKLKKISQNADKPVQ